MTFPTKFWTKIFCILASFWWENSNFISRIKSTIPQFFSFIFSCIVVDKENVTWLGGHQIQHGDGGSKIGQKSVTYNLKTIFVVLNVRKKSGNEFILSQDRTFFIFFFQYFISFPFHFNYLWHSFAIDRFFFPKKWNLTKMKLMEF